jgi:hypothetical protein
MTDRLFQLEQEIDYSRQQAYEDLADAYAIESLPFEVTNNNNNNNNNSIIPINHPLGHYRYRPKLTVSKCLV